MQVFFKLFFCVALHFVKERVAYSISNFSDFKFNTAIYNKDLKYASVFKFFLRLHCACAALCCIVLHCVALHVSQLRLHCAALFKRNFKPALLAALHCRL